MLYSQLSLWSWARSSGPSVFPSPCSQYQRSFTSRQGTDPRRLGMKRFGSTLFVLLASFIAVRGYAQSHTFTRVVIILQENRTPDNIFGSTPTFLPGVDVVGNGYIATCAAQTPRQVPMMQNSDGLVTCYDLGHGPTSWNSMCDLPSGGTQCKMDNACLVALGLSGCSNGYHPPQEPQYQYLPYDVAQPYFAIATNYGFANYMFQTNQGPSFPAHQFIISGTSAPAAPGQNYANYFASENPKPSNQKSGCPAPSGEYVLDINPLGTRTSTLTTVFPVTSTRRLPVSWRISPRGV